MEQAQFPSLLPKLLEWTQFPPVKVDPVEFNVGLADVFTKTKPLEAIPFLIANLSIERYAHRFCPWLKTDDIVIESKPSIAALIAIGPPASQALIALWPSLRDSLNRIEALYAITHIADPQAKDFITALLAESEARRDRGSD